MKRFAKRTLVLLLVVLMSLSSLPPVFAQNGAAGDADITSSVSAAGENPLSDAIAAAVNEQTEGETPYNVLGVELDGLDAGITCYAPAGSTIVAALYDEDTGRMVTSGAADLTEEKEYVGIRLAECELPAYYYVKVFLLAQDHTPLCKAFTCERYTRKMQEFYAVTPEDFDPGQIVLYQNGSNFAAVKEGVAVLESDESVNTVLSFDHEKRVYTFGSPDAAMQALQPGDMFYLQTESDLFLGTITNTESNADGSVTLFADPEENVLALFDHIRIDTSAMAESDEPAPSNAPSLNGKAPRKNSGDEYEYQPKEKVISRSFEIRFSSPRKPTEFTLPDDWREVNVDNDSLTVENESEAKLQASFSGVLTMKMDLEYCYSVNFGPDDYYLNLETETSLTGEVTISALAEAKLKVNLLKLDVPTNIVGLTVFIQATFSIGISGEVKATGELKLENTHYYHRESADPGKNFSYGGKPEFEITFKTEVDVTVTAELKLASGVRIALGVVCADAYAKVTAEAKIKPLSLCLSNKKIGFALFNHDWSENTDGEILAEHDCDVCLCMDVTVTLTLGVEITWFWDGDIVQQDNTYLITLMEGLDVDIKLAELKLLSGSLRASYVKSDSTDKKDWEFEWITDDVVCPHMRFLTKVNVTEEGSGKALENIALHIDSQRDPLVKLSEYARIPGRTELVTDQNGTARCYLPAASYSLACSDPICKIVSCEP